MIKLIELRKTFLEFIKNDEIIISARIKITGMECLIYSVASCCSGILHPRQLQQLQSSATEITKSTEKILIPSDCEELAAN
jgi:hypothetical protein